MHREETVDLPVGTIRETEQSYLFNDHGIRAWVDKTKVEVLELRKGKPSRIRMTKQMARHVGLVR